jgi:hypothetical protein
MTRIEPQSTAIGIPWVSTLVKPGDFGQSKGKNKSATSFSPSLWRASFPVSDA